MALVGGKIQIRTIYHLLVNYQKLWLIPFLFLMITNLM